jgi:protein phosphatase PTC1
VCSDQEAVELVRGIQDPQLASKTLVDHALARFSTDNLSCMVVRFDNKALKARKNEGAIGVDGDQHGARGSISEADAIVSQARKNMGEPEQPMESAAAVIMEEESEPGPDPGPELNADALEAAKKNP